MTKVEAPHAEATSLAMDIGGTKMLVALVRAGKVLDACTEPTPQGTAPAQWVEQAARMASPWQGQYQRVAAAVSGLVEQGVWSPLNPKTLQFPAQFPLASALGDLFGCAVRTMNDAQAAAWGEFRWGAGQGHDMVYLTVSTGLGGGVVLHGQLHQGRCGLAGHFGVMQVGTPDAPEMLENTLSGRWMANQAEHLGHAQTDAKAVFALAAAGQAWAQQLIHMSAQRLAVLCRNIQLTFAPHCIVVGGGIGLAPGYIGQVQESLAALPVSLRPTLVAATLGAYAGVIGAADHAATQSPKQP